MIPDLVFITCEVIPHAAVTTRIPHDRRARSAHDVAARSATPHAHAGTRTLAPRHLTLPELRDAHRDVFGCVLCSLLAANINHAGSDITYSEH